MSALACALFKHSFRAQSFEATHVPQSSSKKSAWSKPKSKWLGSLAYPATFHVCRELCSPCKFRFHVVLIPGLRNAKTYHLLWACGVKPDAQLHYYRLYKEAIMT